jgi:hypothetical protein
MGTEVDGHVVVGGQKVAVHADFGSDQVVFHGGRKGAVKYKQVEVLTTGKGILKIRVDAAIMEFPLGNKVERIAAKIRKPPGRLDKMGIKPGAAIDLVGDAPNDFLKELDAAEIESANSIADGMTTRIAFVKEAEELLNLPGWVSDLEGNVSLWIVYPKGGHGLRESDVLDAGRDANMKDIKVVRFNDKLTALKFVVPLAER